MRNKKLLAHIFLKRAKAVRNFRDERLFEDGDAVRLAREYERKGADGLVVFDLSTNEGEHGQNLALIREIAGSVHIPVIGGGHINGMDDVKKLLYAGCAVVFLNMSKEENVRMLKDASKRFGKERLAVCIWDFPSRADRTDDLQDLVSFALLFGDSRHVYESVTHMPIPTIPFVGGIEAERLEALMRHGRVAGISGRAISDPEADLGALRAQLVRSGIAVGCFESDYAFSDFKKDADGLVPVIVQDFYHFDVLMMGHMDEEAYRATLLTGKMTYYDRARKAARVAGEETGQYQLLRKLSVDCAGGALLAQVIPTGPACHTGHASCFYQDVAVMKALQKRRDTVFEDVMRVILDRKSHPKEGSYTNYLFDHGTDLILKKVGEEATEIVIAAKNANPAEIKYEIGDFLYHMMVLMAQCGITWDDITEELAKR